MFHQVERPPGAGSTGDLARVPEVPCRDPRRSPWITSVNPGPRAGREIVAMRHATMRILLQVTLIGPSLALWMGLDGVQAQFYRWSDETGTIHYSDHLPPERAPRGHVELDRFGIEVRTSQPPAAPADPAAESVAQAPVSDEASLWAADAALLETARTRDELLLMRDGKLAELDALVQVARESIRRERAAWGDPPSERPAAEIDQAREQVQHDAALAESEPRMLRTYWEIIGQERRRAAFQRELAGILRRLDVDPDNASAPVSTHAASLILVACSTPPDCRRVQALASRYLLDHLDHYAQMASASLLVLAQMDQDERRHFTLARLEDADGSGYLVLDLQCKQRLTTDVTCRNPNALAVVAGLRDALTPIDPSDTTANP